MTLYAMHVSLVLASVLILGGADAYATGVRLARQFWTHRRRLWLVLSLLILFVPISVWA